MSRVCPNVDCDNGEVYEEPELGTESGNVVCPDCGTTLEPFSTDMFNEEEEETEEDEEDWDNADKWDSLRTDNDID